MAQPNADRHYAVVRYYTDFSAGLIQETVAEDLTFSEAQSIFAREKDQAPGEDVVLIDQLKVGLAKEVDGRKHL